MTRSLKIFSSWLLGVIVTCVSSHAQTQEYIQKTKSAVKNSCPSFRKFKPVGIADGASKNGTGLSSISYEAPDGTYWVKVSGNSPSQSAAEAQLDEWVQSADKVLVNGWKLDAEGHVSGRRVEALVPSAKGSQFAVMWTSGHYIHEIRSSLACKQAVLETEKNIHDAKP